MGSRPTLARIASDSYSVWNFTLSPGWTQAEAATLKRALMKLGFGRWSAIQDARVLPNKTVQQLNGQAQRLLGQQSTAAFNGLHVDLDRVRAHNAAITTAERKNGLVINSGVNPTKEIVERQRAELQAKYGLSPGDVEAIQLERPPSVCDSLQEDELSRAELLASLRRERSTLKRAFVQLQVARGDTQAAARRTPIKKRKGRLAAATAAEQSPMIPLPAPGARVRVWWEGDGEWFEGAVLRTNPSHDAHAATFSVLYDSDGMSVTHTSIERWEALPGGSGVGAAGAVDEQQQADKAPAPAEDQQQQGAELTPEELAEQRMKLPLPPVGAEIRVHWSGDGEWYEGTVKSVDKERGFYTVFYPSDGVTEEHGAEETWKTATAAAAPAYAPAPKVAALPEGAVGHLMMMGFTATKAKAALAECGGNVELAVDWLFSNCVNAQ